MLIGILFFNCNMQKSAIKENNIIEIDSVNLKNITYTLANDSMEGRGAGYKGNLRAAKYVAQNFKDIGLKSINQNRSNLGDYLQPFDFYTLGDLKPWQKLSSQNVVGILKGNELANEYIVIGGHLDGQGLKTQADLGKSIPEGIVSDYMAVEKDTIWNSAVDNAVSIAAITEIARVLKNNKVKLKRSIIFVGFNAEENSLDGSVYFVNNPIVPLNKIKAMINLEKIVGDPDAMFAYCTNGEKPPVFEKVAVKTDSLVGFKVPNFGLPILANTDHYPFIVNKIPAITIGTGSQINIHTSLDHPDRLDYNLLQKRSQYILSYLINLANNEAVDFKFTDQLLGITGVAGGPATKDEMLSNGFTGERAFKVANVINNSLGDKAGILPEDLVVAVNGNLVKKKPFYQGLEDAMNIENLEGNYATLDIIRSGKRDKIKVKINND